MRRTVLVAGLGGLLALAVVVALKPPTAPAEPDKGKAGESPLSKSASAQLPVAGVVLFSSGVGYFQREGEIEGNSRVDLSFPVQDINDLLKSMVVQDLGGGQVSTISFDSQEIGRASCRERV